MKISKEQRKIYWQNFISKPGGREKRKEWQQEYSQKRRDLLARIKDVPCLDCGGRFHFCQMEFDHRPGTLKELSIGRMKNGSLSKVLEEIEKCDIVCANCHAFRTWQRWQKEK